MAIKSHYPAVKYVG